MNDNVRFEIKADAFLRMTGMLAPGKHAWSGPSYYERTEAWEKWNNKHGEIIAAMLDAAETICYM